MRVRFLLILLVMLLSAGLSPLEGERAQERSVPRWEVAGDGGEGYIIVRQGEGTACRVMTRQESEDLRMGRGRGELRELSDGGAMRLEAQQTGMKVVLRATAQLDANPTAKQAFLQAAAYWESIIASPITVVIDVDFGPTRFGTPYSSASVIGATSNQTLGAANIYGDLRGQLVAGASNPREEALFAALPAGAMPTDLGPTTSVFTSSPVLRALGFLPPNADPAAEAQFGPPPSIGFNSAFSFDFDPSNGVDFDKIDFLATAIHEIGHALGFSSFVGSAERTPSSAIALNVWDFYRFRPGVTLDNFTTAPRVLLAGGDHTNFAGLNESALSTARIDGQEGDGRQAPHWKDDAVTGQLIGIMDPTASNGLRDDASAEDLRALSSFGYRINDSSVVSERISFDDARRDAQPVANNAIIVSRFAPSRYPSTVRSAIIQIPVTGEQPSPAGGSLRIVIFADPNRTGQPPVSAAPVFSRDFTIPLINSSRFVEFSFNGPVISSGDFYLGIQTTSQQLGIPIDTTGPPTGRSFISLNNGASFQPLNTLVGGSGTANFMARAVVTSQFGVIPTPSIAVVSPESLPVGAAGTPILLRGSNFQPDSIVRWNGSDRSTTFVTGSQIVATLTAADLAAAGNAAVTVFTPTRGTPGGGSSAAFSVRIGGPNPFPVITRLDPASAPRSSTNPLTINLFGLNFTSGSQVRVGGADRQTTFVSAQQLRVTLTPADLTSAGVIGLTVFNPAPGGGTSSEQLFSVVTCTYQLSSQSLTFNSTGGSGGVLLTVGEPCAWTVTSDSPWVSFLTPANAAGSGKFPVRFSVAANTAPSGRLATLTIGGQIIPLQQLGLASSVSAASFATSGSVTADSIIAVFGAGLARSTTLASALPLPTSLSGTTVSVRDSRGVSRFAPLFFVSPQQVNYLVPSATSTGTATVTIALDNVPISSGIITVSTVAPGLFSANSSGRDVAAATIVRLRGGATTFEQVASFSQADQRFQPLQIDFGPETDRLFLALYGGGIRGRTSLQSVSVRIADLALTPDFAGAQPEFVGLDQVNVELPRSLKGRGLVNLSVSVDGQVSNQVTLTFK